MRVGTLPHEEKHMNEVAPIPFKPDPEMEAIIEHLMTGKPLDPELYAESASVLKGRREKLFEKHGYLNVAVDLIRESRDEE